MFESLELELVSSLLELESSLEVVEELPELLVEDDDEVLEVLVFEEPALLVACGVELPPPPPPPPPHAVITTEQDANRINAIFELVILFSAKKEPTYWSVLLIINFQNLSTLM